MNDKDLLSLCEEFFYIGDEGLHCKIWRKGLPKSCVGNRAGNEHHSGYKYIKIRGKLYAEHRLVWLMVNGAMPDGELDHKDGNKHMNYIGNLRKVTRRGNCANRNGWSASGFKGVYTQQRGKPWCVHLTVDGSTVRIGSFNTKEEAARAYDIAALKYNCEHAKLNFDRENYQ